MTPLVAYLLLFTAVGAGFIFVHLVIGKLIRPDRPGTEKQTIYECGEPTIGSAWIQFDLRFYVVALLFVIFDVEVAFFFPWAEVFGRANDLQHASAPTTNRERLKYIEKVDRLVPSHARPLRGKQETQTLPYRNLQGSLPRAEETNQQVVKQFDEEFYPRVHEWAKTLAWLAFFDILVFFGVLLVGFAYLWKRGDLAWVRSVTDRAAAGAAGR